jgi:hypothetical protein
MAGNSSYAKAYVAGFDWGQVANTLKARALLRKKDYAGALAAAQLGVAEGKDLKADHSQETPGAWNLYYDFLDWNRGGYMSCDGAHIVSLIDTLSPTSRFNSKTDERARYEWYFVPEYYTPLDPNMFGIFYATSPYDLVTYVENELILAECYARTGDNSKALDHLNNVRTVNENTYGGFTKYDLSDFGPGQIEDGADQTTALINEILEEKYVSLFGQIETFSDVRRTKNAIGVPINTGTSLPARFLIPQSEINSNRANVPAAGQDLFAPLELF